MYNFPNIPAISRSKATASIRKKSSGKKSRPCRNFGGARNKTIDPTNRNNQSRPIPLHVTYNLDKLSMFYAFWLTVVSCCAAYLFADAGYSTLAGALITHGTFSGTEFLRMFKRRGSR